MHRDNKFITKILKNSFLFSPGYVIEAHLGSKKITTYTKYVDIKWNALIYIFIHTQLQ